VPNRKPAQPRGDNHKDEQCPEGKLGVRTPTQVGLRCHRAIDTQAHFLNEFEIAEILGISVATVRRWRLKGRVPTFVKVAGTLVRYRIEALEAWLETQPSGGDSIRAALGGAQ